MKKELISTAVARRLDEVRARVRGLDSQNFGEMGFFVSSVKELLLEQPDRLSKLTPFSSPTAWASADADCLTSLRVLALHGAKTMRQEPRPPIAEFLNQLKIANEAREPVFDALAGRYAWPLNFSFEAEDEVREYVLMRLMTVDRTSIENNSALPPNADELLLKLNLISVHAATLTDLRFLDALNYYYELLPATLYPESPYAWLQVSCFALYARALSSWL